MTWFELIDKTKCSKCGNEMLGSTTLRQLTHSCGKCHHRYTMKDQPEEVAEMTLKSLKAYEKEVLEQYGSDISYSGSKLVEA